MGKINVGKVIVGGLLAGVVMNAFDFLTYGVIFKNEMQGLTDRLHLDAGAMESASVMATFIVCDLLIGLLLVWWYAAIRTRFGPGPKTAIFAALGVFLTIEIATYGMVAMGIYSQMFFFKASAIYLVTVNVASVVGAWAYKE